MPLFKSLDDDNILHIIGCLDGYTKIYEKNQIIYNYFDHITSAGIVVKGEISVVMHNSYGNEYALRKFTQGTLFGEAYACIPSEPSAIQIIAQKQSTVLFLKFSNLFLPRAVSCPHASKITANLLQESAKSNIFQNKKIQLLTEKHIRDKLLIYLCDLNSSDLTITLPFNREGFANYLGVERSALSRELCKMKKEGLIDFHKNHLTILSDSLLIN
jgi:CRP-like cAMP-binding protein